jgi:hypothetical protein
MKKQFTLSHLLIAVTAACLVLGIIVMIERTVLGEARGLLLLFFLYPLLSTVVLGLIYGPSRSVLVIGVLLGILLAYVVVINVGSVWLRLQQRESGTGNGDRGLFRTVRFCASDCHKPDGRGGGVSAQGIRNEERKRARLERSIMQEVQPSIREARIPAGVARAWRPEGRPAAVLRRQFATLWSNYRVPYCRP